MPNWTSEQQLAIDKEGTNIIVSAGAGSGKTAVLSERALRKLKDGIDINHLLILTFTNAAAAEMKNRIRKKIKDFGLTKQLDYIDSAYITTFDSFAQSIVKKYHYLLNISRNIKIIDSSIISIQKDKFISEVFESKYGSLKFNNFISCFCVKDDTELKKSIIQISNKLDLKDDKEDYLNRYINDHYNEKIINKLINDYEKMVIKKVHSLKSILYNIEINGDGEQYSKIIDMVEPLISSKSYDEIKINSIIKLPTIRNTTDEFKKYKDSLNKTISEIHSLCELTLDELKNNLLSTRDNVEVIIDVINELEKKINVYKQNNESYEFTDIAKMAIKIVKDNDEVREELKHYFNEIMVDEYQDTSDLQETFINLISNNNVYMVGDIKQSIYRFRHANPEIFRNKYNNYSNNKGGFKIDLLKNFRSRSEVLNNINEMFDFVMNEEIGNADYRISHRMVFGNKIYDKYKASQNYDMDILNYHKNDDLKNFKDEEIEAFIIANDIKNKIESHYQVLDKDTNMLRNFNYGDACIIMDRGTSFDTYKKIFEYLSIPLVVWQDEYLNESDDIAVIKNIICLIVKINKQELDKEFKYYFTSIARSYLFEYSDNDIFNYFINNNFSDSNLYKISLSISEQILSISNSELIDLIINKFDVYKNTIKIGNIEKSIIRIDNLKTLLLSLSELGYTPYDLPDYFKLSVNTEQRYSLNTNVPNNVNLMNIHKSKGLEFSVCYFSGFAKSFNDSDIKESFLFDDKYGIIIPYYNNGIGDTFLKDLFKSKYKLEDISERIRLFYVGVTRAKEKMILVVSLDEEENNVHDVVDNDIRLNYKSFLNIINSIKSKLKRYINEVDLNTIRITKDYNIIKESNYKESICDSDVLINKQQINIDNNILEESHFSKVSHNLCTEEEFNNMKLGTHVHYLFETTDFKNPVIDDKFCNKIINFIKQIDTNCNIYKEYEFMYEDSNNLKHGIIDLMLEYEDHINIIDYKLKHIVDDNYRNQITGYKNFIQNKTGKKVNTYLYSIIDEKFNEIK